MTHTRTHAYVGFANPFLVCEECNEKTPYWHDPDRCHCNGESYNIPCRHTTGVVSICYTWDPVDGCSCVNKKEHDKP